MFSEYIFSCGKKMYQQGATLQRCINENEEPVYHKIINNHANRKKVIREIYILRALQGNAHIVKLINARSNTDNISFIQEDAGKPLRNYAVVDKKLNSETASTIISQLYNAIGHLRTKNIAHLDLHAGNIMISSAPVNVILIDFGLSNISLSQDQYDAYLSNVEARKTDKLLLGEWVLGNRLRSSSEIGFPFIQAPELRVLHELAKVRAMPVFKTVNCDLWSLGCIVRNIQEFVANTNTNANLAVKWDESRVLPYGVEFKKKEDQYKTNIDKYKYIYPNVTSFTAETKKNIIRETCSNIEKISPREYKKQYKKYFEACKNIDGYSNQNINMIFNDTLSHLFTLDTKASKDFKTKLSKEMRELQQKLSSLNQLSQTWNSISNETLTMWKKQFGVDDVDITIQKLNLTGSAKTPLGTNELKLLSYNPQEREEAFNELFST